MLTGRVHIVAPSSVTIQEAVYFPAVVGARISTTKVRSAAGATAVVTSKISAPVCILVPLSYLKSTYPTSQPLVPTFFTVQEASKSVLTLILVPAAGKVAITLQL